MITGFAVTFERWTHEDAEFGDTDDRGFVIQDVSLRDAMRYGLEYSHPEWCGYCETDQCPVRDPRWLTFTDWNDGTRERYETGVVESRSLHIPDLVTDSSRRRIARLFGAYGA